MYSIILIKFISYHPFYTHFQLSFNSHLIFLQSCIYAIDCTVINALKFYGELLYNFFRLILQNRHRPLIYISNEFLSILLEQTSKKLHIPLHSSQLPKSSDAVAAVTCFRTTSSSIFAMSLHPSSATSITLSR